ncbi:NAD-dependent protein deacetylase [Amphritea balenae]|uniref:protein acetyllysine N-acetyltransferase n=1 Tax=Amphritea balenae TaxID=452629 RepID=A0A3P1SIU8_9GAMM|nr:NAD-dependent protein deacetylase [Amphritea balenae]RRC97221.1 NAD-dependent protein deacetylase [Amphritea balenae]GGK64269.1 NAD-dependent protein deacetylase 2 [Amphritea balenae]
MSQPLIDFIHNHPQLFILTGAGCSTSSGIPDYRDKHGQWKRSPPVQHRDFMTSLLARQRFWARSLIGWPLMAKARPNAVHNSLQQLEQKGYCQQLVTQNVDRLHQQAGQQQVIDLHGRSDQVRCMECDQHYDRNHIHQQMADLNPAFAGLTAAAAPDGDADLEGVDFNRFQVTDCELCGGILKPNVVFFGDNVPKQRVFDAIDQLQQADGILVIGSSLMVYSGFRFCKQAQQMGKPIVTLTRGKTRADDISSLKLDGEISDILLPTVELLPKQQY